MANNTQLNRVTLPLRGQAQDGLHSGSGLAAQGRVPRRAAPPDSSQSPGQHSASEKLRAIGWAVALGQHCLHFAGDSGTEGGQPPRQAAGFGRLLEH
jgi:hypothetical protein